MAAVGVKLITSRPLLALLLLALLAGAAAQRVDDGDVEFDDDGPAGGTPPAAVAAAAAGLFDGLLDRLKLRVREKESYSIELYCAAILSIFLANMVIGSARNKRLALEVMGEVRPRCRRTAADGMREVDSGPLYHQLHSPVRNTNNSIVEPACTADGQRRGRARLQLQLCGARARRQRDGEP